MEILHGIPETNDFFLIALPRTGRPMGDFCRMGTPDDPYIIATLKHPKTGSTAQAEIHSMWRFSMKEPILLTSWAKLAYGITGPQLLTMMQQRYRNFSGEVEFLLMKKL